MKVIMDNHIKSSNFAESFLVVEDLTSISNHFGKGLCNNYQEGGALKPEGGALS